MTDSSSGVSTLLNRISITIGHAASWLTLAMVLVTFVIVVMRYAFDSGVIWLQESLTWMHAAVFMLGAAYTLQCDDHVRVDIFYREMSAKRKAWVNLLGVLIFLWPLCAFFIVESWGYVAASWGVAEASRDAGGLPYPALPILKSILIVMPCTVALQGLSILLTSITAIRER